MAQHSSTVGLIDIMDSISYKVALSEQMTITQIYSVIIARRCRFEK